MADPQPRTGTSWTIVVDNAVIRRALIGAEAVGEVTVTYVITHRGDPYLSGTMNWEDATTGIEGAWSKEFLLPPTPGVCVVTVTVTKDTAIGELSQSIRVR